MYRGSVRIGTNNTVIEVNGNGEYERANGDRFIGDFVQGKLEGIGQQISPTGDVYEGMFVNGQKHGKGETLGVLFCPFQG